MMPDNPDGPLVLTGLPDSTDWTFGGVAYGLEPLTMPHPRSPDALGPTAAEDAYDEACRLIPFTSGHTAAHAGESFCPLHSVHFAASMT